MEFSRYINPIIRWRRLILGAGLIAGLVTLAITLSQPTVYEARATLIIGQSINNPNPSSNQFYLEQELAKIYADMAGREPIRRATMEALGLNSLPIYLVRALPNSQLIEITVTDTSPPRAQAVAAELANQMIQRSPTGLGSGEQEQEDFVSNQLGMLEEDIEQTQDEIAALELRLGDLRSAREIADYERQIAALDEKLRTLQTSYASLLSSTPRGAVNTLTIIEPPELPTRAAGPNRLISVILATVLGMFVGVLGAYVIEYMDNRVQNRSDVTDILGWQVLATISEAAEDVEPETVLLNQPRSVIANSFRLLKTNLELAGVGSLIRSVLITGPTAGEGKSMVSQNIALAFAKSGKNTILVEGDTQRPRLDYAGQKGLSDVLIEGGEVEDYLITPYSKTIPTFRVLSAGTASLGSSWFLDTPAFDQVLSTLKKDSIVIVDGPPAFISDSLVLASKAEGVLTVVRLGHTEKDTVRSMKNQLRSGSIHILGVIINGIGDHPMDYPAYLEPGGKPRPNLAGAGSGRPTSLDDVLASLRTRLGRFAGSINQRFGRKEDKEASTEDEAKPEPSPAES